MIQQILVREKHIQRAWMHLSTAALQIFGKRPKVYRDIHMINPWQYINAVYLPGSIVLCMFGESRVSMSIFSAAQLAH
jgi:hypothetical protein